VATINIRGWNNYTSTRDVQDLIDAGGDPEVVVLTETKRARKTQLPRHVHKRYCIFESRRPEAAAGVAVLVKRQWCAVDAAHHEAVPKDCQGYVLHLRLQPVGSSAVHLLGVYMPGDAERKAHRSAAYAHLETVLATAAPGDTVLMTGDWNACLREEDRPGQPTAAAVFLGLGFKRQGAQALGGAIPPHAQRIRRGPARAHV
jgi:exonuclease III